jgi:hypothetical protein
MILINPFSESREPTPQSSRRGLSGDFHSCHPSTYTPIGLASRGFFIVGSFQLQSRLAPQFKVRNPAR